MKYQERCLKASFTYTLTWPADGQISALFLPDSLLPIQRTRREGLIGLGEKSKNQEPGIGSPRQLAASLTALHAPKQALYTTFTSNCTSSK